MLYLQIKQTNNKNNNNNAKKFYSQIFVFFPLNHALKSLKSIKPSERFKSNSR